MATISDTFEFTLPPDAPVPRLLPLLLELRIVTKSAEVHRLGDVIKPSQLDLIARMQRQLDRNGRIRIIILKARQIGMSTIVEGVIFILTLLYDHFNSMVVSHEKDSAAGILNMTRNYWETFTFKRFWNERYNGRVHLAWDNHSDIHIATAKNTAAGRSRTIQALHASEVAFWPDPDTLMKGLNKTIPKSGLNMVVLESTANGVGNYFHRMCNKAMKGEGDYEFCFYPWWDDPEYTITNLPPDARAKYAILGSLDEEEMALIDQLHLPEDRLLWRRWCIANECNGDVEEFHQEYPSTPHEAFISSGRNVFFLPDLLDHYEPKNGQRGDIKMVNGRAKFVPSPLGYLTVYRYPVDRDWGVYLIGADPTHTNNNDYACAQVINRNTMEQVAVFRRKVNPIDFAQDLYNLGMYYNRALIAPEKTGPGYATVGALAAHGYPNIYQTQRIDLMQGMPTDDTLGWATSVTTKDLAISHLVKLVSDPLVKIGDAIRGLVIHDRMTLMEMRDYVHVDKGLGYANSDGSEYDDGVMALAIAAAVHQIEPSPAPYVVPDPADIPARVALPRSGSGPVLVASHEKANLVPTEEPAPDDPEPGDLPPPVWQAWGSHHNDYMEDDF